MNGAASDRSLRSQDHVGHFSDCAFASAHPQRQASAPRVGMCVGRHEWKASGFQAFEIVDVVAHVRNVGQLEPSCRHPRSQCTDLVEAVMDHLDAQLCRARGHDRVGLAREDQYRNVRGTQQVDAEAISSRASHRFAASFVDQHSVVGVNAVEIGNERLDSPKTYDN